MAYRQVAQYERQQFSSLVRGTAAAGADELMALERGTRLGPYEIAAQIGVGGMGGGVPAGTVKLRLTALSDAQHGVFTMGQPRPISCGSVS